MHLIVVSGVFLIKNSTWSFDMLDIWYGNYDSPFAHHPHWEQAAFVSMMTYGRWIVGYGVPPLESCELGMDPFGTCPTARSDVRLGVDVDKASRVFTQLHSRVMFHPQRWMNSYPAALSNFIRDWEEQPSHVKYTHGDFIVSFSGCNFMLGAARCNAMYEDVYDESERNNEHVNV